jgi:hypothetical protein
MRRLLRADQTPTNGLDKPFLRVLPSARADSAALSAAQTVSAALEGPSFKGYGFSACSFERLCRHAEALSVRARFAPL